MARQVPSTHLWSPIEAEALGLLEAIKWACSLDITHAVFETDCKGVVDKLGHVKQAYSELDAIILDIQRLMHTNLHFSVSFVRRQADNVSHILATRYLLLDACMDLYHVPPYVAEVLFNEMT